jgi:hypothetical protein
MDIAASHVRARPAAGQGGAWATVVAAYRTSVGAWRRAIAAPRRTARTRTVGQAERLAVFHPPGVIRVPTPAEEWARRRMHGAL